MPEIRHYIVTRTQTVKVRANGPGDAARIGDAAFIKGRNGDAIIEHLLGEEIYGGVESEVREVGLEVVEDR